VQNGYLDVVFPEGEWTVSGLVVKRPVGQASRPVIEKPKPPARPGIRHVPPKTAIPGRVLDLSLLITPTTPVKAVRLHYRPVNQLAEFKVIENAGAKGAFTIPAQDVSGRWDLMYYFEILNRDGSGWFQPDPGVATPYYVVPVTSMEAK
jgi:hypothetical protein